MKISYKLSGILLVLPVLLQLAANAQSKANKPAPQLGKGTLKQVISAMTLEEKSKLVVGMGFKMPGVPPPVKGQKPKAVDVGGFKMPPSDPQAYEIPEKVPGAAGRTHAIARLGIPSITV